MDQWERRKKAASKKVSDSNASIGKSSRNEDKLAHKVRE